MEEFINAKTASPGLRPAMRASMSVPLVAGEVPPVNGIAYVDGSFDPMPLKEIIERFKPTDILILPNTPFECLDAFRLSNGEYVIAELAKRLGPKFVPALAGQVEKFLLIKEQMRKSMEYLQEQSGVNIGIMWPPDAGLDVMRQDPYAIETAVLESARSVISRFDEQQPHDLRLYDSNYEGLENG